MRGLTLIHRVVWGPWLMCFFLAAGVWYTIRSGGFQFWGFGIWWKATVGSFFGRRRRETYEGRREEPEDWKENEERCGRKKETAKEGTAKEGTIKEGAEKEGTAKAQIRTACTALAATVGTGNIVGVATAIIAGGPGALFWMWVSAMMGMMTAYAEVYLGIESRVRGEGGVWLCGPFMYLERTAGKRGLAVLYAFLCLLGSLGMGSMVQANSLAETARLSFHFPPVWTAVILVLTTGAVIRGGKKSVGEAAAGLVPLSAGVYLVFSCTVIFICRRYLGSVLADIVREAFRFRAGAGAAAGWGMGNAVRYGIARGVFSNEAGLGTMAVLHGDSPGQDGALQGMWAMFEVFFDTIVVCTITGLVILCGGKAAGGFPTGSGAAAASWCFSHFLGKIGGYSVSLSLMLFAFATVIGWYYLGSQALGYLTERGEGGRGGMKKKGKAAAVYQYLYLGAAAAGCLAPMSGVWLFSDIVNGLLALPNLIALFLLWDRVSFPCSLDRKKGR